MSDNSSPSKKTLSEKRKNRSALEQFQRERKRSVEDEDVSSEKQRRKINSGPGTSQRKGNELYSDNRLKGPNSDETTPLVAKSSHNSTQGPTCLVQKGKKKNGRSAPEQSQRKRKNRGKNEDDSSQKQRRKISSGPGTSQRKGPNSDDPTPLVAQSSHNSTQGPTCLVQNGKRKNSRSAPEQSQRKRKNREEDEDDSSEKKSQRINSGREESQRKRKNRGKNEDDSSQKQSMKISSGPRTSQRKGPNSDDPTPLVAQRSHNSTQGPTCLIQKEKSKNSSSAPEQSQRKRRKEDEDDSSEKQSRKINSGPGTSQSKSDKPNSDKNLREELQRKYIQLDCLGAGGYGSVYSGYRRDDKLPVAIKHIPISNMMRIAVALDEVKRTVPREVELMLMAGEVKHVQMRRFSLALLDWYELQEELVIVMERPMPSKDLFDYTVDSGGPLNEDEAKVILRQLVEGLINIHSNGVLHRDIKPENILIQTTPEGPRLHIMDFGCACAAQEGPYTQFFGTRDYAPPEWHLQSSYQAMPYTVWQVGLVLYFMLSGTHGFHSATQIINEELNIPEKLSQECKDLLRRCLAKQPEERPSLDSMLEHPWLTHT